MVAEFEVSSNQCWARAELSPSLLKTCDVPKTLVFCQTKDVVVKVYLALSRSIASKAVIQHQLQQSHTLICVVATIAFGLVSIVSILTTMASCMSYTSPVYGNRVLISLKCNLW